MNDSEAQDGAPRRQPLPTSRRIALAIYGVLLCFVIVAGFYSVIPPIFWPEVADTRAAPPACREELSALEDRLLERAADHVRHGGERPSPTPPSWLSAWDTRFHALSARCPNLPTTSLERLRFRIERTLWRFDRNEAERVAELHKLAADSRP